MMRPQHRLTALCVIDVAERAVRSSQCFQVEGAVLADDENGIVRTIAFGQEHGFAVLGWVFEVQFSDARFLFNPLWQRAAGVSQ